MRKLRSHRGSAIAELGPALFVLFVMIFFPMLDVLAIGMQFCCGWYLNHEATHELSISKFNQWTTALNQVKTKFDQTGIPNFVHAVNGSHTYTNIPANTAAGLPAQVTNTTSLTCKPFLYIPMFFPVAGVNENMTIKFNNTRTWETFNPNDPLDPGQTSQTTQTFNFTEP